jgi:hypothetical protein
MHQYEKNEIVIYLRGRKDLNDRFAKYSFKPFRNLR